MHNLLAYISPNSVWGWLLEQLSYDPSRPLLFNSGLFLVLFLVFFGLFILMRNNKPLRIVYVVLFSLFFYYKSSGFYFWILIVSTIVDYSLGWAIFKAPTKGQKKFYLILSLIANLGILGYFKYTKFFAGVIEGLFNTGIDVQGIDIFLPVGISFYTFQTMSYSIDVYRGKLKPEKNILDFAFFVTFFPQLVAGPIVRAADFLGQVRKDLIVRSEDLGRGFFLICGGLFKKAVISDYISVNFVDRVFQEPTLYSGFENLMAIYGYAMQIYCDFSGYSDMAIGLALIMGFTLPINFNAPYKSTSVTEFWRRWHISLSSWLRDYLYISLGGNRKGNIRTYVNLMLTMLLGGLWHGAAWRFIIWGAMHGIWLAIERVLKQYIKVPNNFATKLIGLIITFHFVCFCWIFFRVPEASMAFDMLKQIFTFFHFELAAQVLSAYSNVFLLMLLGYVMHMLPDKFDRGLETRFTKAPLVVKSLCLAGIIWIVIQTASSDVVPFIYFQF